MLAVYAFRASNCHGTVSLCGTSTWPCMAQSGCWLSLRYGMRGRFAEYPAKRISAITQELSGYRKQVLLGCENSKANQSAIRHKQASTWGRPVSKAAKHRRQVVPTDFASMFGSSVPLFQTL